MSAGVPVAVGIGSVPVHCLLARNAGPMTGPGTNTYVIGSNRLAVLDPGPIDAQHLQAILQFAGERPIDWIFVTHTHGDHSPGAAPLHAHTGAQVIGLPPPAGSGQDPEFRAARPFHDGERIDCGEFTMRLIHTPGHVSNHLCFLLEQEGLLFTGDHILEGMTPVVAPPDGCMRQYLLALAGLKALPLRALAPAHGRVMHQPNQVIETLLRHRARREAKLLSVLAAQTQPLSLQALVEHVYDDIAPALLPLARRTLLAHLLKLEAEGRAQQIQACWEAAQHGR
jgi:glyoxylase-like metal-dependent hydrolase (beta-lactamase superfamily II)